MHSQCRQKEGRKRAERVQKAGSRRAERGQKKREEQEEYWKASASDMLEHWYGYYDDDDDDGDGTGSQYYRISCKLFYESLPLPPPAGNKGSQVVSKPLLIRHEHHVPASHETATQTRLGIGLGIGVGIAVGAGVPGWSGILVIRHAWAGDLFSWKCCVSCKCKQ